MPVASGPRLAPSMQCLLQNLQSSFHAPRCRSGCQGGPAFHRAPRETPSATATLFAGERRLEEFGRIAHFFCLDAQLMPSAPIEFRHQLASFTYFLLMIP